MSVSHVSPVQTTNRFSCMAQTGKVVSSARENYIIFADLVAPSNGLTAITVLASQINRMAGVIFSNLKNTVKNAGQVFGGVLDLFTVTSLIGTIKYFVKADFTKEGKLKTLEIASKVCSLISGIFKTIKFCAERAAVNLGRLASTIGRIPILSWVTTIPQIMGTGVQLVLDCRTYKKRPVEIRSSPASVQVSLNKVRMRIVQNIAKIAISIITLIGLAFSVGFLASSGAFMIGLNLASAAFWVYTAYYDKKQEAVTKQRDSNAAGSFTV